MHTRLSLLLVTCLAAPVTAHAQTDIVSTPVPNPPPPLRLFNETVPEPRPRSIEAVKSANWWEPPTGGNEIPRWTIGQTVTAKTPGGFELSAGLFGRRADPLPLFLSQGVSRDAQRAASASVIDPKTHRVRWDAKLGITAAVRNAPQLRIKATGELFVPLSNPSPVFRTSRAYRFGVVTVF